jgi:hypothetical protein
MPASLDAAPATTARTTAAAMEKQMPAPFDPAAVDQFFAAGKTEQRLPFAARVR